MTYHDYILSLVTRFDTFEGLKFQRESSRTKAAGPTLWRKLSRRVQGVFVELPSFSTTLHGSIL